MKSITLNIPTPCHESWDAMTPTQEGKYCKACAKIVLDLTTATEEELIDRFKNSNQSICARISTSVLGKPLTSINDRQHEFVYLKAIVMGAALLSTAATWSAPLPHSNDHFSLIEIIQNDAANEKTYVPSDSIKIQFLIRDNYGELCPFMKIAFLDKDSTFITGCITDLDGETQLWITDEESIRIDRLRIFGLDYLDLFIDWNQVNRDRKNIVEIQRDPIQELQGGMIVVGGITSSRHSKRIARRERRKARKGDSTEY